MKRGTEKNRFLSLFRRTSKSTGDDYTDWEDDIAGNSPWLCLALWVFIVLVSVWLVLAFYWSREPDPVNLVDTSNAYAGVVDSPVSADIIGSATTASLIMVMDTLLSKPGGYLANDIAPPGVFLDNIPNWEYGVLVQGRDLAKALREVFSRSQSQSTEDPDLVIAEPRFNFESGKWILPSTESVYRRGITRLKGYHSRLVDPTQAQAQFYARADNLEFWLGSVEKRLGSLSQRLSASVGKRRLNTDLAGEADAAQSTPAKNEVVVKTPWSEIDDVFYEARGTTWALIHFLKATEIDFADVLEKKNAAVSVQQIIRELESTQQVIYSPVILNGDGLGVLANHSLVMASYISRAHAAIIDLRELLTRG